jgi:hypothetical protein
MGPTNLHLSRCEANQLLTHYVEAKNAGALSPCPFGLARLNVVLSMYTVNKKFTVRTKGQGRPARPRTQHDYHHDTKVIPEAATAVTELLMMDGKTSETY